MTLFWTFLLVFSAGPAAFWLLARFGTAPRAFATIAAAAFALIGVAIGLNLWLIPQGGRFAPGFVVAALWAAWIAVIALCAIALRRHIDATVTRKAVFALGSMATTLPWFGLYAATMVAP